MNENVLHHEELPPLVDTSVPDELYMCASELNILDLMSYKYNVIYMGNPPAAGGKFGVFGTSKSHFYIGNRPIIGPKCKNFAPAALWSLNLLSRPISSLNF